MPEPTQPPTGNPPLPLSDSVTPPIPEKEKEGDCINEIKHGHNHKH